MNSLASEGIDTQYFVLRIKIRVSFLARYEQCMDGRVASCFSCVKFVITIQTSNVQDFIAHNVNVKQKLD